MLYIIDLDGTIYDGETPRLGAKEFFDFLQESEATYLFITNTSAKTKERISNKLVRYGITQFSIAQIVTPIDLLKSFLERKGKACIYINGGDYYIREEVKKITNITIIEEADLNQQTIDYYLQASNPNFSFEDHAC